MMADATVKCPKCGTLIPITEALAGPLIEATKKQATAELQAALERQKSALLSEARSTAQMEVSAKLDAAQKAAAEAEMQAESLQTKLTIAQQAQAAALRKERELADRERELDLTVELKVTQQLADVRNSVTRAVNEDNRLKLLERDTLIESMQKKVAELQQKVEQGSQQMQGEVQELDLERALQQAFPFDLIEEVAKGVNGADVKHAVHAPSGADCGLILYESKRTKNWSPGWLPKLREDGRRATADILVLVSTALPPEVETFNQLDNVWVCAPAVALPLATALRATLLAVHATKQAQDGMKTKSEEVYGYVTGPQFRHRVEALVEAFTAMQDDLVAEQRASQRQWAKRQTQIERVMTSTSGMFGDLQGIAGRALPEPEGLALPGSEE